MVDHSDVDGGAWAGDDIPVPDPPADPPTVQPNDAPAVGRRSRDPASSEAVNLAPVFGSLTAPAAPSSPPSTGTFWSRRNRLVAVVAAAFAFVAVVLVVSNGDDGEPLGASSSTTVAPDHTLARTSTTTSTPTSTTTSAVTGPENGAPSGGLRLALPAEVAAISEPTEVLMATSDGLLHTLSLPSGVVRSVPVVIDDPSFFRGQPIVVAPDAAAFATGTGMVIVPREGSSVVTVDADRFGDTGGVGGLEVVGWEPAPDGTTRFLVANYGPNDMTWYSVGLDGSAEAEGDDARLARSFDTIRPPDGTTFVNDAGGVYAVDDVGFTRRIDDGVLRAVSASSMLIRQCTPELDCGDVLVDRATGESQPIAPGILPDELQFNGFGLDLAPDGSAVSALVSGPSSQDLVVIDLVTGDRVQSSNQSFSRGSLWAADSSGVFGPTLDGNGIEFLDRASGMAVPFADEVGPITSVAVRAPAAELGPASAVSTTPISFANGAEPSTTGVVVTAIGRSGNIVVVDIDARSADVWSVSEAIPARDPSLFPFGEQVAVASSANPEREPSGYITIPGQERPLPPALFGPGPVIAGPTPGTVWTAPVSAGVGVGVSQVLIDLDAAAAATPGRSISVPGGVLLGGDGLGGLVVMKGGDVYIATSVAGTDETSLQRLTSGELLAIGSTTAFVRECDDTSNCDVVRVDRADGARSVVADVQGLLASALPIDSSDPPFALVGSAVSPDGDLAVVRVPGSEAYQWVFVDFADGALTPLDNLNGQAPFVWSGGGASAVTLIGADLVVVDAGGVAVVQGLGSLRSLAGEQVVLAD